MTQSHDETPVKTVKQPSLPWRLVRFVMLCGLAFAGGLGATYAYDRIVEAPAANDSVVPFIPAAPTPIALPPAEAEPRNVLDPVQQ
ncbi:MAG: hypothetical protein ACI9U2_005274, partial [Bradymonadia bacterium]